MAYTSPYGTGDRRAVITVTNTIYFYIYDNINTFVNGNKTEQKLWTDQTNVNRYLRFQFPEAIIVDHIKWIQSGVSTHGTHKIQGSNNGIDWTDVGSSFILGGAITYEIDISANTTAYTYYQFLGVSGNMNSAEWIYEVEFSWTYTTSPSDIKSVNGIDYNVIKSVDGVAIVGIKKIN
jgi:hypothetical protein